MVVDVQKAVKVEVSLLGTIALRCVVATCCVVAGNGGIGVRGTALFRVRPNIQPQERNEGNNELSYLSEHQISHPVR